MSARWFALDVLFLANPHIQHLGDKFGPAGPLAVIHLLGTAKILDEDGRFEISYTNLARGAFLKSGTQAREIIAEASKRGIIDMLAIDKRGFTGHFPDWDKWQRNGDLTAAERAKRYRDKRREPSQASRDASRDSSHAHIHKTEDNYRGGTTNVAEGSIPGSNVSPLRHGLIARDVFNGGLSENSDGAA